jgi:hypothetical protein
VDHGGTDAVDVDIDGRGHRWRVVHDHEVARLQEIGERRERGVHRIVERRRNEETHAMPADTTGLGRFVGLVLGVEIETERERSCERLGAGVDHGVDHGALGQGHRHHATSLAPSSAEPERAE